MSRYPAPDLTAEAIEINQAVETVVKVIDQMEDLLGRIGQRYESSCEGETQHEVDFRCVSMLSAGVTCLMAALEYSTAGAVMARERKKTRVH